MRTRDVHKLLSSLSKLCRTNNPKYRDQAVKVLKRNGLV